MGIAIREAPEDLIKSRHALARVLFARPLRMRAVEPTTGVNFAQLLCGHPRDGFLTKSGAPQCCIVDDNGNAIARQAHVEFYSVGARLHRQRERSERVFRSDDGSATMRDY